MYLPRSCQNGEDSGRRVLTVAVRAAQQEDVAACKRIADAHRDVFGFLTRGVFVEAMSRSRLLVAQDTDRRTIGFVRFNHRIRGMETVLYDIGVAPDAQRRGVGRALVGALVDAGRQAGRSVIVLRCPEGLPANAFYASLGFRCSDIEEGRRRRLLVWRIAIEESACSL
jgi:ribosomal protein S18 acetylase RimI-like enzyme